MNLGESLRSGAGNALSELLYGTGKLKGAGDAFIRGARTGAVMSGLENISDTVGTYGMAGSRLFNRKLDVPVMPGRDPKGMCGSPDPFDLEEGLGSRKGYHGGAGHSRPGDGSGFSLGGFVKDVLTGAVTGGLGSAGFYGAGKAVEALRGSVAGRRNDTGILGNARAVRYREGRIVDPLEVTYDMRLNPEEYAYAIADKYGINLRGSGQKICITFDPHHTKGPGLSKKLAPTNIILGPQALISEEELARTISHELNHARSWLKGGWAPEDTARAAENALGDFINGGR